MEWEEGGSPPLGQFQVQHASILCMLSQGTGLSGWKGWAGQLDGLNCRAARARSGRNHFVTEPGLTRESSELARERIHDKTLGNLFLGAVARILTHTLPRPRGSPVSPPPPLSVPPICRVFDRSSPILPCSMLHASGYKPLAAFAHLRRQPYTRIDQPK